MYFSWAEVVNVVIGSIIGAISGGLVTYLVAAYYYRQSIQPQHYLNEFLDVEEPVQDVLLAALGSENSGEDFYTDAPVAQEVMHGPLLQWFDFTGEYGEITGLKLTPLGRLVSLFFARKQQLESEMAST